MKNKKTLLILFGELRTFEYVIPLLQRLDDVDIVISTWNQSVRNDTIFCVNRDMIIDILPNVKQIHITNINEIYDYENKENSWKLYWHWKHAINNLEDSEEYGLVIVHRCDLLSNWHSILDFNIEDETLYFHHERRPYKVEIHPNHFKLLTEMNNNTNYDFPLGFSADFWINDFYFFGDFTTVKKFINSFNDDNYWYPHYDIWKVINENNFKIGTLDTPFDEKINILEGSLVRDNDIDDIIKFTLNNDIVDKLTKLIGNNHFYHPLDWLQIWKKI